MSTPNAEYLFAEDASCPSCGRATLGDALLRSALYLDGFVWITEPESSELEGIREVVRRALGCKTWDQVMDLAHLRDARRGMVKPSVTPPLDVREAATPHAGERGDHHHAAPIDGSGAGR